MRKFFGLILVSLIMLAYPLQEEMKYDVTVTLKVVPIFATDKEGNPVLNLKKEDLELFIEGKKVEIAQFERLDFTRSPASREELSPPERVVFFIFDGVFTSWFGIKRAKKIAEAIVKQGTPKDSYVILTLELLKGLNYIIGSESDKKKVLKIIKKLKPLPSKLYLRRYRKGRGTIMDVESMHRQSTSSDEQATIEGRNPFATAELRDFMNRSNRRLEMSIYRKRTKEFAQALSQLEYALKTISSPKLVFLFSEGMSEYAFREQLPKYTGAFFGESEQIFTMFLDYLKEIVKAINLGGSVLFTINPGKIMEEGAVSGGESSLRFLAKESGGKYFEGKEAEKLAESVTRTTYAYYEIAFYPEKALTDISSLEIKCKRKDVQIHTLRYLRKEKPFLKMSRFERRLYVLNALYGGTWSRMVAKIARIKYKKKVKKEKNKALVKLEVRVPALFQKRYGIVYLVKINPSTREVDFKETRKKFAGKETMETEVKAGQELFFALVDEETGATLYNKVKI